VAPMPAGWRVRAVDAATEVADRAAVERDIWGQW
jgi:hypothetical protein